MTMTDNEDDKKPPAEDDDSDFEIEGMDLEGDDEEMEDTEKGSNADGESSDSADDAAAGDEETIDKLATEDHDEMEAAKKEQMELMEAERKQVIAPAEKGASAEEQLQYLLAQSDVFAHFLRNESITAKLPLTRSKTRKENSLLPTSSETTSPGENFIAYLLLLLCKRTKIFNMYVH